MKNSNYVPIHIESELHVAMKIPVGHSDTLGACAPKKKRGNKSIGSTQKYYVIGEHDLPNSGAKYNTDKFRPDELKKNA